MIEFAKRGSDRKWHLSTSEIDGEDLELQYVVNDMWSSTEHYDPMNGKKSFRQMSDKEFLTRFKEDNI
jgi:hypothetical protein